jgi:hypothetical protein
MPHHHHTNPSHPPAARKLLSWRRVVAACAAVAALVLLLAAAPATEDPTRWRSYLMGSLPGGTRKETVAAAVVAGSFAGPAASMSSPAEAPLTSSGEVGADFHLPWCIYYKEAWKEKYQPFNSEIVFLYSGNLVELGKSEQTARNFNCKSTAI